LSKKKEPDRTMTFQRSEARYDCSELIAAASSFGVKPEVMVGALKLAGKNTMTKAEAEKAVKDFLERKV
jgi:hypothetical protein